MTFSFFRSGLRLFVLFLPFVLAGCGGGGGGGSSGGSSGTINGILGVPVAPGVEPDRKLSMGVYLSEAASGSDFFVSAVVPTDETGAALEWFGWRFVGATPVFYTGPLLTASRATALTSVAGFAQSTCTVDFTSSLDNQLRAVITVGTDRRAVAATNMNDLRTLDSLGRTPWVGDWTSGSASSTGITLTMDDVGSSLSLDRQPWGCSVALSASPYNDSLNGIFRTTVTLSGCTADADNGIFSGVLMAYTVFESVDHLRLIAFNADKTRVLSFAMTRAAEVWVPPNLD